MCQIKVAQPSVNAAAMSTLARILAQNNGVIAQPGEVRAFTNDNTHAVADSPFASVTQFDTNLDSVSLFL